MEKHLACKTDLSLLDRCIITHVVRPAQSIMGSAERDYVYIEIFHVNLHESMLPPMSLSHKCTCIEYQKVSRVLLLCDAMGNIHVPLSLL